MEANNFGQDYLPRTTSDLALDAMRPSIPEAKPPTFMPVDPAFRIPRYDEEPISIEPAHQIPTFEAPILPDGAWDATVKPVIEMPLVPEVTQPKSKRSNSIISRLRSKEEPAADYSMLPPPPKNYEMPDQVEVAIDNSTELALIAKFRDIELETDDPQVALKSKIGFAKKQISTGLDSETVVDITLSNTRDYRTKVIQERTQLKQHKALNKKKLTKLVNENDEYVRSILLADSADKAAKSHRTDETADAKAFSLKGGAIYAKEHVTDSFSKLKESYLSMKELQRDVANTQNDEIRALKYEKLKKLRSKFMVRVGHTVGTMAVAELLTAPFTGSVLEGGFSPVKAVGLGAMSAGLAVGINAKTDLLNQRKIRKSSDSTEQESEKWRPTVENAVQLEEDSSDEWRPVADTEHHVPLTIFDQASNGSFEELEPEPWYPDSDTEDEFQLEDWISNNATVDNTADMTAFNAEITPDKSNSDREAKPTQSNFRNKLVETLVNQGLVEKSDSNEHLQLTKKGKVVVGIGATTVALGLAYTGKKNGSNELAKKATRFAKQLNG